MDEIQAELRCHEKSMLLVGNPVEEERRGADHVTRMFKCAEPACRVRVALTVSIPWGS